MNVLVIPEDFRLDQYILQPLIAAMMSLVGKPKAKVQILSDPLLGSVTAAMSWNNLEEIFDRYGMVDIFLLVVDRDLDPNRRIALDNLEKKAGKRCVLLAENAWQEIEVWALAAQKGLWKWAEVRSEKHPKEKYFEPYAFSRGLQDEPGRGRKTLGLEAAAQYMRVRKRCPEESPRCRDAFAWQSHRADANVPTKPPSRRKNELHSLTEWGIHPPLSLLLIGGAYVGRTARIL